MLRIVAAIVMLLSSCSVPQQSSLALTDAPHALILKSAAIPRIVCLRKGGWISTGSGVWIGKNYALTADHVVAHAISCSIEGEKALIIREDGRLDYALITAYNQGGIIAPFSCVGVVPGRQYRATGYADGETYLRSGIWQALFGRVDDPELVFNGLSRFNGLIIDGMSGGPITEESTGRVVAIVNARNEEAPHDAWGRALADTPLCRRTA